MCTRLGDFMVACTGLALASEQLNRIALLAIDGKKSEPPPTACKLDGEGEAKLIAMRLNEPPQGYCRWTLQLLAEELVTLNLVESICSETVRKTLKKTA